MYIAYYQFPNKRTGHLSENDKETPTYIFFSPNKLLKSSYLLGLLPIRLHGTMSTSIRKSRVRIQQSTAKYYILNNSSQENKRYISDIGLEFINERTVSGGK